MKTQRRRRSGLLFAITFFAIAVALCGVVSGATAQELETAGDVAAGDSAKSDLEALRRDVEELKSGQNAIWQSLEEIKALLQGAAAERPAQNAAQPPPNVIIDLAGQQMQGSPGAKLAVVEFSDYQCPYCARHTRDTFPLLEKEFVATGKIRYAMLDLPLRSHSFAFKAAEAATCAASQGKFWEMHDLLFEKQDALQPELLSDYAEQIGIRRGEFEACLRAGQQVSVKSDLTQASRAGISATPTFLVGWLQPGDQMKTADVIRGAQPYATFERVINQLLEQGPPAVDGE